jgi:hypothetical protein
VRYAESTAAVAALYDWATWAVVAGATCGTPELDEDDVVALPQPDASTARTADPSTMTYLALISRLRDLLCGTT